MKVMTVNYEEFKEETRGLAPNILIDFAIRKLIEKKSEQYLESEEFIEIFDHRAEKLINGKNDSLMRKILLMDERIITLESLLEKGSIEVKDSESSTSALDELQG